MRNRHNGDPETQFIAYLARQGMKLTNQRRLILTTFYQCSGHFSAEDIYQRLRGVDSSIGQATVYRTLKLLHDAGLARELRFGNDVARFEPRLDNAHHDHLICEACGKIVPVLNDNIEKLQVELADAHGFKPTYHRMYLYGICPDCLQADKQQP